MLRIGVIGMGLRVSGVAGRLYKIGCDARVTVVADPHEESARRCMKAAEIPDDGVQFVSGVDELIKRAGDLDGLMIGTRCHLHTDMAVKVAPLGLPVMLEKPVAINADQLQRLQAAYAGREQQVVVSFPLRVTPLFRTAMEIIRSGRLGTINQVQAINNVTYGGVYFGYWYRNYDQVAGLWLQKATHDFDYINQIMQAQPLSIAATVSQKIYGGDKPHDLRCSTCDEAKSCDESGEAQRHRGNDGGMSPDNPSGNWDHACCYSRDIRNQDSGSALVLYDNAVHACYTQNFISRRQAGKRGAIVTGHHGSLEFDWYTDTIRVVDHFDNRVDKIEVKATGGHGGGDDILVSNFVDVARGKAESISGLRAGLLSVAMCLAAKQSCQTQTFAPIRVPGDPQCPMASRELAMIEN
ncbi:MAG: Gfo/Idh/MocA family oxidoreductase [Phycisphaeraceae bacterium]|nr:Gfo/Idh/MocA family oxidoreductase [Phycisphaeraceae bacterium]